MTYNNLARAAVAGVLSLAAALGLTACGDVTAPGELGENQQILAGCPTDQKLDTLVQWDGSGSNQSDETTSERLAIVRQLARRTAVCQGHLTVSVFSASSGSTVTVYDSEISLDGATDNARLRRVPDAVDEIMSEVEAGLSPAISSLPGGGTDINGVYRLAGEQQAQLGEGYQLVFVILTDGLNNLSGIVLDSQVLSPDQAAALADQVSVPQLPGAEVTVAGLGRIASGAAPSELVDGLVAYYDRLCENTGAASCMSVTDWR